MRSTSQPAHRPTLAHGRRIVGIVLVGALVGCTAAPGPGATASPASATVTGAAASPSATAGAAGDGFSVTVVPDPPNLDPGRPAEFTMTFRNGSDREVTYWSPECGGAVALTLTVPMPAATERKAWSGIAADLKRYVLASAQGPGGVPALGPVRIDLAPEPCTYGQVESTVAPGRSVTSVARWSGEIVAGVPAPAGRVTYQASALYDRQNSAPSIDPDHVGPIGNWIPDYRTATAEGTIELGASQRALASPDRIIEAVLADPSFAKWLDRMPAGTWSGTNLFLVSQAAAEGIMPKGPSWEFDLFREDGVPRNWAIAFVDPFDASVRSVTYCNDPCDR